MKQLKRGDKVTYTKQDPWGKTWKETSKVFLVHNGKALLENGDWVLAWAK